MILIISVLLLDSCKLILGNGVVPGTQFDDILKQYNLEDGRSVFILDGGISEAHLMSLNIFMSANDHWRYVLNDATNKAPIYDDENGIPWKSWKDPAPLKQTRVGMELKNLVQTIDAKVHGNTTRTSNFEMNEIYAALIRRGDRTKLHNETGRDEKSYSMLIYNNIVWRKNAYGELLFFDNEGEIFATIRSKFGRVVVWDSSISYVIRPPSISQQATLSVTFAIFSMDDATNRKKSTYFYNLLGELENPPSLCSSVTEFDSSYENEVLGKHLTMLRKNRNDHFVAVFDGLFGETELSDLRTWVIKYGTYYFDGSIDADSDNVQWIAGINVDDFIKTSFWPVIKSIANYVSNASSWYPYDVACNLIRNYDHTRFHLDTSHDVEKEMTFLLYLSPNWTAADYGETAFMETNDDSKDNEYVAEVVPMFGRAVIFDGNFPHSARPPSVTHYSARYTLAVKLAFTKKYAVGKTFQEEFKHEEGMTGVLSYAKKLMEKPEATVVEHKLNEVAEYLAYRQIQKQLSEPTGQEEDEDSEDDDSVDEDSEDEDSENDDMEDDERSSNIQDQLVLSMKKSPTYDEDIEENEELESMRSSLPPKDQKLLLQMEKHHHYREKLYINSKPISVDTLEKSIFEPKRRQRMLRNWIRLAKDDSSLLNDYLELYLKQRAWFKNYIAQKFLAML